MGSLPSYCPIGFEQSHFSSAQECLPHNCLHVSLTNSFCFNTHPQSHVHTDHIKKTQRKRVLNIQLLIKVCRELHTPAQSSLAIQRKVPSGPPPGANFPIFRVWLCTFCPEQVRHRSKTASPIAWSLATRRGSQSLCLSSQGPADRPFGWHTRDARQFLPRLFHRRNCDDVQRPTVGNEHDCCSSNGSRKNP